MNPETNQETNEELSYDIKFGFAKAVLRQIITEEYPFGIIPFEQEAFRNLLMVNSLFPQQPLLLPINYFSNILSSGTLEELHAIPMKMIDEAQVIKVVDASEALHTSIASEYRKNVDLKHPGYEGKLKMAFREVQRLNTIADKLATALRNDEYFANLTHHQQIEVINNIAGKNDAILLGLCSDYINSFRTFDPKSTLNILSQIEQICLKKISDYLELRIINQNTFDLLLKYIKTNKQNSDTL